MSAGRILSRAPSFKEGVRAFIRNKSTGTGSGLPCHFPVDILYSRAYTSVKVIGFKGNSQRFKNKRKLLQIEVKLPLAEKQRTCYHFGSTSEADKK